jgi:hypothetical protein
MRSQERHEQTDHAAAPGARVVVTQPWAGGGSRDLLALQRSAGNAAVSALVMQRARDTQPAPLARDARPAPPLAGSAPAGVIQRAGLTAEDTELAGEAVGEAVLRVWNWLASFLRTAPQDATDSDDDLDELDDDEFHSFEDSDDDEFHSFEDSDDDDEFQSFEDLDDLQTTPAGQQALVIVGRSGTSYDFDEIVAALISVAIRRDFEDNRDLLRKLAQQTMHLNVTSYSPDIEEGMTLALDAIKQRKAAELEAIARIRAAELEAIRRLAACQRIHETLRQSFQASQSTATMQKLARSLAQFVVRDDLGDELTTIATDISERLDKLQLKQFKVPPKTFEAITGAPALFDALMLLSNVVDERLSVQEKTLQPTGPPRLNKHQLEAEQRRKKQQAKREAIEELDTGLTDTVQEALVPVVVARTLPPYVRLGSLYGKEIHGRIDWHRIYEVGGIQMGKLTKAVADGGEDIRAIFEAAMRAGVVPASTTGVDCTKPEGSKTWVVKVSYPTAKRLGLEHTDLNIASPLATEEERPDGSKYLTFDKMVYRH